MIYEFTPTQDLHGYNEPWAPGTGANKFDQEMEPGRIKLSDGTDMAGNGLRSKNIDPILPETTYRAIRGSVDGSLVICYYDADDAYLSYASVLSGNTFTTPEGAVGFRLNIQTNAAVTEYPGDAAINYPSTVTTFTPYANVCPPIGYNIWDPSQDQMIQVYSGYVDDVARKLYLHPVYEEYDGEELVGPWMSSLDKYTEEGTPTTGAFVVDFGGDLREVDITDFMLQTLLDSLGIRRFISSGALLLNSLMDQAQGRVRSEE